jgi:hypothetical protein
MSLYLDEIFLNVTSKESFKSACQLIEGAMKNGFPPGVTLKAGPWASNEEPKIVLVLDIQDHELTFRPFSDAIARGMVRKRKLSPIVDWTTLSKTIAEM